jgi:hypothetical protein
MPVSVLERLLTALFAAGLLTSFPDDAGVLVSGFVLMPPIVFPDEPRLIALSVAGVFEPPVPLVFPPPVPLMVLPLESDPPDEPPLEEPPPDICATEGDVINAKQETRQTAKNFIGVVLR